MFNGRKITNMHLLTDNREGALRVTGKVGSSDGGQNMNEKYHGGE